MSDYKPRLTAPSTTDKNWIHYTDGGYNYCIEIKNGSCLPNCVGYVWGRWRELLGKSPKLSKGDASTFWKFPDGYERTQYPRLGSVICWDDGGYGHVGTVEAYNQKNGEITVGQSAYNGTRFYLTTVQPPYDYGRFKCNGFIHLPGSEPLPKAGTPTEGAKITHLPTMFTFPDVNKTKKLVPQMSDGSTPKFTYSTSNSKVATVSAAGVIKSIGAGTATITVKAGTVSKSLTVTVPKFKSLLEVTEPIYKAAVNQAIREQNARYEWAGAAHQTLEDSKTRATCVTYANCVLFLLDILKEKSYIYQDAKGNPTFNGATSALKKDCTARAKKFLVIKRVNNVRPYKLKNTLKRGDILMYTKGTVKAGPGSHICIFTGEWKGEKAVVWDNNWSKAKMKKTITFDKPLDSFIRIHRFRVNTQAENGTITLSNNYLAAETVTIKYSGKKPIKKLTVDGKVIDAKKYPKSYTFKDLKTDHSISVIFE